MSVNNDPNKFPQPAETGTSSGESITPKEDQLVKKTDKLMNTPKDDSLSKTAPKLTDSKFSTTPSEKSTEKQSAFGRFFNNILNAGQTPRQAAPVISPADAATTKFKEPHPAFVNFRRWVSDQVNEKLFSQYGNYEKFGDNQPLRLYLLDKSTQNPEEIISGITPHLARLVGTITRGSGGYELERAEGMLRNSNQSSPSLSKRAPMDFVLIVSELKIALDLIEYSEMTPEEKSAVLAPLNQNIRALEDTVRSGGYMQATASPAFAAANIVKADELLTKSIDQFHTLMNEVPPRLVITREAPVSTPAPASSSSQPAPAASSSQPPPTPVAAREPRLIPAALSAFLRTPRARITPEIRNQFLQAYSIDLDQPAEVDHLTAKKIEGDVMLEDRTRRVVRGFSLLLNPQTRIYPKTVLTKPVITGIAGFFNRFRNASRIEVGDPNSYEGFSQENFRNNATDFNNIRRYLGELRCNLDMLPPELSRNIIDSIRNSVNGKNLDLAVRNCIVRANMPDTEVNRAILKSLIESLLDYPQNA